MIQHHADKPDRIDLTGTAAGSFGLPWRMAMTSREGFTALKAAMTHDPVPSTWDSLDDIIDPNTVRFKATGPHIGKLSICTPPQLPVPTGYENAAGEVPVHSFRNDAPVIGCPVTLIPDVFRMLWRQRVELAAHTYFQGHAAL
jgi:hypothetical protein